MLFIPKTHPGYSPQFRRQIVDLVRTGRGSADLAREFAPSGQAIRTWVAQADRQEGGRQEGGRQQGGWEEKAGGLNTAECDELARLRRENKQLRVERDVLSRVAVWFARETGAVPSGSSGS